MARSRRKPLETSRGAGRRRMPGAAVVESQVASFVAAAEAAVEAQPATPGHITGLPEMGTSIASSAGGSYRSADTGSRVVLDSQGLRFYNEDDEVILLMDVATSDVHISGELFMPTDDSSVNRLAIVTPGGASEQSIEWYRAGETEQEGIIYVSYPDFGNGPIPWMSIIAQNVDENQALAGIEVISTDGVEVPQVRLAGTNAAGTLSSFAQFNFLISYLMDMRFVGRARDLVQGGTWAVAVTGSLTGSANVNLPLAFNAAPFVVATCEDSRYVASVQNITSSSFTIFVRDVEGNPRTATVSGRFIALGGNA